MNIADLDTFQHFEKVFGNKYVAVRALAKLARKLGQEKHVYHLSESKLMQWIFTGKCPYSDRVLQTRKYVSEKIDDLDDYLSEIDDTEVCEEVKSLYKKSVKSHKLMKCTEPNINSGKRSRVNILLRMIWYQFTIP